MGLLEDIDSRVGITTIIQPAWNSFEVAKPGNSSTLVTITFVRATAISIIDLDQQQDIVEAFTTAVDSHFKGHIVGHCIRS